MNTYYLKKYRKDAKEKFKIKFINNQYNVMKYDYYHERWEFIRTNFDYVTNNLYVAKQTLAHERREYILKLVKNRRDFNKNKELAKL